MNNTVQYKLQIGSKSIPVGSTAPVYDGVRRAWITAVGVFPALTPGTYSVSAHIDQVVAPAIPPGKTTVVVPETGMVASPVAPS